MGFQLSLKVIEDDVFITMKKNNEVDFVLDKLQAIEDKYLQLESMISDPDIIADMNKWQKYTREHSKLGEIVVKFREYKEVLQGLDDAKEMQKEETDDEFKKMIDLEVAELKTKLSVLETELPILLLPKDPNDDKSVIVEIRGGAGGDGKAPARQQQSDDRLTPE